MAATVIPIIDDMPPAPSRATDSKASFNAKSDAIMTAWNTNIAQMNAAAAAMYLNAQATYNDALATAEDVLATGADVLAATAAKNDAVSAKNAAQDALALVQNIAAGISFSSTSTSSVAIGTGSRTFTVQANESYVPGMPIYAVDQADPANYLVGTCTSYTGTTLIILVTQVGGSGTKSAWNISIGGIPGPAGPAWSGGTLTTAMNGAPPVTIASASTVAIGAAAANDITISGTTTITAFDTIAAGAERRVTFSGVLTLTHNGTSLILPGAANITTAAGDVATFLSLGSGNWRCVDYQRASGLPVIVTPSFGGVIGDVFQTYATPQNSLMANGSRYLRSTYSALATKVGPIFDLQLSSGNINPSFYSSFVSDMVSNSRFSYAITANGSPSSNAYIYWSKYQTGSYVTGGTLSPDQDGRYAVMAAASETHLVVLMYKPGNQQCIMYATLDANGDPGAFTEWTPTGLTSHCNGFGVVNGVFWLSYNVSANPTAPRIAWGSNPAAMTVSTPTGNDPRLDHNYSAYVFWNGTDYVLWSGSRWFSGSSLGSLVNPSSGPVSGNTFISRYTLNPYEQKPSYSHDGRRMVHRNGGTFYYTEDGGYSLVSKTLPSTFTLYGAVIAGGEVLVYGQTNSGPYVLGQYNVLTGLVGVDTLTLSSQGFGSTCNLRSTVQGVFIHGSTDISSTRAHVVLTSYDTKTTFATPKLGLNYWIRAL